MRYIEKKKRRDYIKVNIMEVAKKDYFFNGCAIQKRSQGVGNVGAAHT